MKLGISAAVLVAGMTATSLAQTTGVSHPEQVPITTGELQQTDPVVAAAPVFVPMALPVAVESKPMLKAEVSAAPLKSNVDVGIVTRVAGPGNQLPIGTLVKVKMKEELSTKKTVVGARFTAELAGPIERDGRVLLPAGSVLSGRVSEVHGGKRISGQASMRLMAQEVTLPDGMVYPVRAQVIDTDLYKKTKVDAEGTILRKGLKGTITSVGLATGAGAASGAIFGGWPGAIIGAGVGAGVSTVVWLRQDRQTDLPEGTGVTFMLTAAIKVGAE